MLAKSPASRPVLPARSPGDTVDELSRLRIPKSQPVLPRFRMQHITVALARQIVKAWVVQMHSRDEQPVRRDLIEHFLAGYCRLLVVHVEVGSGVRQGDLNLGNVDDVAPDQQLLSSGRNHISRVSRCMSRYGHRDDTRKYLASVEQAHASLVRR